MAKARRSTGQGSGGEQRSGRLAIALTGIALALSGAGCSEATAANVEALGGAVAPAPEVPATPDGEIDLSDAIERARAAFFWEDGALWAGSETHRVRLVEGEDGIEIVALHDAVAAAATIARPGEPAARTSPVATPRLESAPLRLRTTSVSRGLELGGEPSGVRVLGGRVLLDRGEVLEELENRREGLEQSWRFDHRPLGAGDLEVRVAVSGMEPIETTESGVHFVDPETGLGIRYGHATFVDRDGTRFEVPVRLEGTELAMTVPDSVVEAARYPAVLDPVVGPEIAIDVPVTGPRGGNQLVPAVASNGVDRYLVVFVDQLFGDDDVRGVRLMSDGTLLDSTSFRIAAEVGINETAPAVIGTGGGWMVAWQDGRSGSDWDVYATPISSGGMPAMEGGYPVAATAGTDEREPALAWGVVSDLVVFRSGDDATSDVLGVRLNPMGMATETPFVVGGGAGTQYEPAVAATDGEFLVTYTDDPDGTGTASNPNVRGRRLRASGVALIDAAPFSITTTIGFGSQAAWAGGTSYVAVWSTFRTGFYAVNASPIPTSGTVTPVSTEISPGASGRDYFDADVAWNGSTYLVTFLDALWDGTAMAFTTYTIGARAMTAAGVGTGSVIPPTSIAGNVAQASVTSLGAAFYVAYTDDSGEASDIRGTRIVGTTVSTPAGQLLSSGPNDQTAPTLAGSGSGFLAAWLDFRGGSTDAWGALLDASGNVSSGPMLLAGGAGTQLPYDVAWSGSRYVVAIGDGADVRGVTVTAAGIASAPFSIATSTTMAEAEPTVACGPAALQCLVAWTEYDPSLDPIDTSVRAARLDASSASVAVGSPFTVVAATGDQFDPDAAASGTQFYVSWTDGRVTTNVDVRGSRVVSTALDAGGVVIGGAAGAQYGSAVASDGTSFFVTFIDERSGGARPRDVYGVAVGATGTVSGTATAIVSEATADETDPSIAWNGRRYLLAYTRVTDVDSHVMARRLSPTGMSLEPSSFTLGDLVSVSDQPIVAGGGTDQWLVAFRTFTGGAARTHVQLFTDDPAIGGTCIGPSDCGTTGFCVDGVCCSTLCGGGAVDCMACSIAAGAPTDGTCAPIPGCGDAGAPDAGPSGDGGPVDGGATDGGTTDVDGGTTDIDGGASDGGTTDVDGGTSTDAGSGSDSGPGADTGPGTDAGRPDAGTVTPPASSGCSCRVPAGRGPSGAPIALAGLALAMVVARRRR